MITFLFVRHADIDTQNAQNDPDPALNDDGNLRAARLADVARLAEVKTIFTSILKRTIQTAAPLATQLGLPEPLPVLPPLPEFATNVRAGHYGSVLLVVGHSNTLPEAINRITGQQNNITIQTFANLFFVTLTDMESKVLRLTYG